MLSANRAVASGLITRSGLYTTSVTAINVAGMSIVAPDDEAEAYADFITIK